MERGTNTLQDISETPIAVENTINGLRELENIASRVASYDFNKVFLLGCGSSFYSGILVSSLLKRLLRSKFVQALPSSEFLFYENQIIDEKTLIIGFSRSGNTAETVSALNLAKTRGSKSILLSIAKESKGSKIADEYIFINAGIERSIVMTKSFTTLSLAGLIFSVKLAEATGSISAEKVADFLQSLHKFSRYISSVIGNSKIYLEIGREIAPLYERLVFLGSGPSYGVALEASLKFKETSYVPAEALQALEYRHGPIAAINEKLLVFLINPSGSSFEAVYRLYRDIISIGGKTLRLSDRERPDILLEDTGTEELNALEAIVPLQYIAVGYALTRGEDPDRPRNLSRVVERF